MPEPRNPIAPADPEARQLARRLLADARHGALAFTDPVTREPGISRIALGQDRAGLPLTLVSALSQHHGALLAHPAAALMVGEPGPRGDPLTHPRLMLRVRAGFVEPTGADHADLRDLWLSSHPKAKLYIDFSDFGFVRLIPVSGLLNGGFGRAFGLAPGDLPAP